MDPVNPTRRRAGRALVAVAALALLAALWPNARSLYDLTGEEAARGQAAGVVHWLNTAIRPPPRLEPAAVSGPPLARPSGRPYGAKALSHDGAEPGTHTHIVEKGK